MVPIVHTAPDLGHGPGRGCPDLVRMVTLGNADPVVAPERDYVT